MVFYIWECLAQSVQALMLDIVVQRNAWNGSSTDEPALTCETDDADSDWEISSDDDEVAIMAELIEISSGDEG